MSNIDDIMMISSSVMTTDFTKNGLSSSINIVPSSDLRNSYSKIHDLSASTEEPVYITKNGYADGVFFSMEAFESFQNKLMLRFERAVMEKRYYEDIIAMSKGEGYTPQEAADKIRAELDL